MRLEKTNGSTYKVYWENGSYIGDFIVGVDGYYNFWPDHGGGYYDEGFLYAVADLLKELNKAWDTQVQNDPRIGHREHDLE